MLAIICIIVYDIEYNDNIWYILILFGAMILYIQRITSFAVGIRHVKPRAAELLTTFLFILLIFFSLFKQAHHL